MGNLRKVKKANKGKSRSNSKYSSKIKTIQLNTKSGNTEEDDFTFKQSCMCDASIFTLWESPNYQAVVTKTNTNYDDSIDIFSKCVNINLKKYVKKNFKYWKDFGISKLPITTYFEEYHDDVVDEDIPTHEIFYDEALQAEIDNILA